MVDNQLFLIDIASREVTPLTKNFDPCVTDALWSRADGKIYLSAEDRDRVALFRIDPATGKTESIAIPEEVVKGISVADAGRNIIWYGESASSPCSLYSLDTKTLRSTRLATPKRICSPMCNSAAARPGSSSTPMATL